MTDKIALILLMFAVAPILFWAAKCLTYTFLIRFFGFNLSYDANINGRIVKKKVRLNSKTSYEDLVAIKKEMAK